MKGLAEWEALVEGATPGPWEASSSEATMNDRSEWRIGDRSRPQVLRSQMRAADAEFIAAAPTITATLLGFVREVQKLHHIIKDSSLTNLDVDPFWRCSCGALDCPTEQAARKWIGGEG